MSLKLGFSEHSIRILKLKNFKSVYNKYNVNGVYLMQESGI